MARKKPKKPKKDDVAFTNVGSVENEFSGNIGSSSPISFSATIPDLAANSVGVVLLSVLSAAAATGVISSVVWDGITGTKAIPASNSFLTQTVHAYYWINPPDNGLKTIQVNFSAPTVAITVTVHITVGYADATDTVSLDDTSENTGATGAGATVTSTQAGTNEIVFSASSHTANALGSPTTTDCTELQSWDSGGNCGISAYSIPASSGNTTHQHNYSQNGVWAAVSLSFKETADAGITKSLTDTGSGTDVLSSLSASLSRSDSGVGVDNPNLAASLGLSDVALGGDLLDLSASIDVNDTSQSIETFKDRSTALILHFGSASDSTLDMKDHVHNISPVGYSGTFVAEGKYGGGAGFVGEFTSYINYGNYNINRQGTVAFWMYPRSNFSDHLFAHEGNQSGTYIDYYGAADKTVRVYVQFGNGIIRSSYKPETGTWSHVLFTWDYDSDDFRLYMNNTFDNAGTGTFLLHNGNRLYVGAWPVSGAGGIGGFRGTLDEFILLDHVADATERTNIYNGTYLNDLRISASIPTPETGTGIDDLSGLSAGLSVPDGISGNDLLNLSASLSVSDSGLGVDEVTISTLELILKSICDYGIGIDAPELIGWLVDECAALFDSNGNPLVDGTVGEELYIRITALLSLLDSASATDTTSISASIPVVDIGLSNETITLSATLSLNDTGTGLDDVSVSAAEAVLKTISDVASALDNINISATLSTTETSTGQDALSLSVSFSLVDTASGIDSPDIAASLGLTDSALGGDFLDLSASLALSESGSGADTLNQLLANLVLSESGNANDLLQLLASLSVGDLGSGSDDVSVLTGVIKSILDSGLGSDEVSISVDLSVQDTGIGTDALSISVSLSILDTGTGVDEETVNKVEILFKSISDIASGSDNLSISVTLNVGETVIGVDDPAILASLSVGDLAETFDSPVISANLTITDTASATDLISILQSILKQITDAGTGTDAISQITASIPVSETGLGTDQIGQLLASLLVTDFGTGVDVVVKYDTTTQIIKISFIIKNNTISFAMKANNINFDLGTSSIVTDTSDPTIGMTFSAPSISFSLNPDGG